MRSIRAPRWRWLDPFEIEDFHHVTNEVLGRVRLIRTNLLPPAADGMTLGRFVFLRDDHINNTGSTLLAHELVHVRQFAEMGAIRFFRAYLGAYFSNLRRLKNHRQAYLEIPLEQEARAVAADWHQRKKAASSTDE